MKANKYVRRGAVLTGALLLGACSMETESPGVESGEVQTKSVAFTNEAGEEVAPVETLSFEGGVQVGFFEPEPGELQVLSWGPNGTQPPISKEIVDEGLSATQLYSRLSGAEAPASLKEAQARAEKLAGDVARGSEALNASYDRPLSDPSSPEGEERSGDTGSKSQAVYYYDCQGTYSYDEWFNCNFCYGGGDYDITWMWVTGDGNFTRVDRNHTYTTVSVYGGGALNLKVEKRTWSSWSTHLSTSVANGYWVQSELGWDFLDFDTRATVTNASGDSYHWCSYGWST